MSLIPAADILADFGEGAATCNALVKVANSNGATVAAAAGADDLEARVIDAYGRGLKDARAKVEGELEARLEQMGAAHQEQLDAERLSWAQDLSAKLERALESGLRDIEGELGSMTARVLKPFLSAALRRQAIEEFAATLRSLLDGTTVVSIEIHGPEDLWRQLRPALAGRLADATFHAGGESDLRFEIGQTIVETQLAVWAAKLDMALDGEAHE